jgi:hypothetical protein
MKIKLSFAKFIELRVTLVNFRSLHEALDKALPRALHEALLWYPAKVLYIVGALQGG